MTMARDEYTLILDKTLNSILGETYRDFPPEYPKVFNVKSSTKQYEKVGTMGGLPTMPVKNEGDTVTYEDPSKGYSTTFTHSTFGSGYKVTLEMQQDELFGFIKKLPEGLARAARHRQETDAWNIFNRAFATYLGSDGVTLCSTAHPLYGGGTQRNRPSTDADFSYSAIQQMLIDFENFTDNQGMPRMLTPKTIIIPSALIHEADELVKSDKNPTNAENAVNTLRRWDLDVMVGHYLTSTTAYFAVADKKDLPLDFYWRMKPQKRSFEDEHTWDYIMNMVMRFSCGWWDYTGIWGTTGV